MTSPSQAYKKLIQQDKIDFDESQQDALSALDQLFNQLTRGREMAIGAQSSSNALGVYMWGQVGRGKTLLMNLFYQSLPEGLGKRLHFHHFMADLHKDLNRTQGVSDPLKVIAKKMAQEVKVICFDEFFVSDIADAMLLGGLIEALFEHGVYLVATSNIPVVNLFQNQLQKERFKPTIELLNRHLQSFELSGEVDYRYRLPLDQAIYFVEKEVLQQEIISRLFLADDCKQQEIQVNGRDIFVLASSKQSVWFDFVGLCEGPRSSNDYIELAKRYRHMVVSGIPELSNEPYERIKARGTEDGAVGSGVTGARQITLGVNDDAVRRFISLVDECYDQRVVMYFQADVPLDALYCNGALQFEFRRTLSRITEMQTASYLFML
ncbi:cell division protein ZapE [Marinomonas sp. 15G1-11]|uniref:Cell division protein ZapE n=1 Tax=Marinomonas phaeophyticola TaxID=3004091 RepID=A0ABT4JXS5_9GAMM|nr:cell division protein ZapE [Marinomonas sp. 15G1-11]MCZ2723192.1 cell division protein ZapE [Marinomonas sp. 15G1-11]